MSVTVRLTDGGIEDTNTRALDFAVDESGALSLLDKPATDETADEIAIYAPGAWVRARVDAPQP